MLFIWTPASKAEGEFSSSLLIEVGRFAKMRRAEEKQERPEVEEANRARKKKHLVES